jgi:hypothetical protein
VKTSRKTTRPRGFAPWTPKGESLELVQQVKKVLTLFRAYLPVTIRQVFYRLVSTVGYPKDEKSYSRLCDILNRARRAGLIDWDDFRDDGFQRSRMSSFDSPADWAEAVLHSARSYRLDRQQGQARRLVVWCEAAGMVPQLERVAKEFSVPVLCSGGFDSVTAKHSVAVEWASMGDVTVLHLGDHDPSGVHMFGSLDEDIRSFLDGLDAGGRVEFQRLAVTLDQVVELNLPTAPAKETDRRSFDGETVQCEAIPPDELARILERAILDRFDPRGLQGVLSLEEEQRTKLVDHVSDFLESLR